MAITTSTLAARPELIERVWDMPDQWDEFMDHDPIPGALAPETSRSTSNRTSGYDTTSCSAYTRGAR